MLGIRYLLPGMEEDILGIFLSKAPPCFSFVFVLFSCSSIPESYLPVFLLPFCLRPFRFDSLREEKKTKARLFLLCFPLFFSLNISSPQRKSNTKKSLHFKPTKDRNETKLHETKTKRTETKPRVTKQKRKSLGRSGGEEHKEGRLES